MVAYCAPDKFGGQGTLLKIAFNSTDFQKIKRKKREGRDRIGDRGKLEKLKGGGEEAKTFSQQRKFYIQRRRR